MRLSNVENEIKQIPQIKTDIAIISTMVNKIMNNHLTHIDQKLEQIDARLDSICLSIAEQKPTYILGSKAVEYIIFAVIGAVLFLVLK